MLPLRDINPTRRFPIATVTLIAINVLVYFVFQAGQDATGAYRLAMDWAVVPDRVSTNFNGEAVFDIFRAMFMHGGLAHLFGNMLYLWIFGDNVEDRLGIPLYLLFYFAGGIAATASQIMMDPMSDVPMLGASGAIAAVLGGYLVLFPGVKVRGLIMFGYIGRVQEISAVWVLGFWFALQVFNGITSVGSLAGGGVAVFAHIGGFVTGVFLMWIFMMIIPQPPAADRHEMLYQRHDPRSGQGRLW